MISRIKRLLTAIPLAMFLSGNASAIDVDYSSPIQVESDSAVIDDALGISTYRGNVVISQGGTTLTADNITVFAKDRVISQIVANGSPATFKQQDEGAETATSGQAEQITYRAEQATLVFSGDATLTQATNSFSGEKIEYDIMRKAIRAKGSETEGTRVKIQYYPTQATDTPTETPSGTEAKEPEADAASTE